MSRLINPFMKAHRQIGRTDAQWDALKSTLRTWLQDQAGAVQVADARALDAAFVNDRLWAQLTADLGLTEIPDE